MKTPAVTIIAIPQVHSKVSPVKGLFKKYCSLCLRANHFLLSLVLPHSPSSEGEDDAALEWDLAATSSEETDFWSAVDDTQTFVCHCTLFSPCSVIFMDDLGVHFVFPSCIHFRCFLFKWFERISLVSCPTKVSLSSVVSYFLIMVITVILRVVNLHCIKLSAKLMKPGQLQKCLILLPLQYLL